MAKPIKQDGKALFGTFPRKSDGGEQQNFKSKGNYEVKLTEYNGRLLVQHIRHYKLFIAYDNSIV